jgi:hypothetical protein
MSLNPLDNKSIEKLVLKNTLKSHYSEKAMIELVVGKIKEIPEYSQLKSDIELTLIVCKMIETITSDSDLKLDKLQTIIEIYKKSFDMSTDDQLALVNVVNFLHQNNSFLYKKSFLNKAAKAVGWVLSKAINIGSNFIH